MKKRARVLGARIANFIKSPMWSRIVRIYNVQSRRKVYLNQVNKMWLLLSKDYK